MGMAERRLIPLTPEQREYAERVDAGGNPRPGNKHPRTGGHYCIGRRRREQHAARVLADLPPNEVDQIEDGADLVACLAVMEAMAVLEGGLY